MVQLKSKISKSIYLLLFLFLSSFLSAKEKIPYIKPLPMAEKGMLFALQINMKNGHVDQEIEKELQRIREIGYRVLSQTKDNRPITFHVMKDDAINAFALPGGFIFITDSMLKLKLTDEELAHLLGHEIAHITQDHHSRRMQKAVVSTISSSILAMVIQVLAAYELGKNRENQYTEDARIERAKQYQSAIQSSYLFPTVANILYQLKYTREYEMEADHYGKIFATSAGYDLKGAEALFDRLSKTDNTKINSIWRSHPAMVDRTFRAKHSHIETNKNDISIDVSLTKGRVQKTLLSHAFYYQNQQKIQLSKISGQNDPNLYEAWKHYIVIKMWATLAFEVNPQNDIAIEALKLIYEQELIRKDFILSDGEWGVLHHLIEKNHPHIDIAQRVKTFSDELQSKLNRLIQEKRSGVPTYESYLKNYPHHPLAKEASLLLCQSLILLKQTERIPDLLTNFAQNYTEKDKQMLQYILEHFLRISLQPYTTHQLRKSFQKNDAFSNTVFIDDSKINEYLKQTKSLGELVSYLNRDGRVITEDEMKIWNELTKSVFAQAKYAEKQNEKGKAMSLYIELTLYALDTETKNLAEVALDSLDYQ